MEKKPHFSPWYFVVGLLVMLAVQTLYSPQQANTLPYSDFKSLLKEGKVRSVIIGADSISGKLKEPQQPQNATEEPNTAAARKPHGADAQHRFVTARVNDPSLVPELEARRVQFTGRVRHQWLSTILGWVMPAVILVVLWALLMRRMGSGGGLMGVGKSKGKIYMQKKTGVTFADVAGIDEAKAELMEVVQFLAGPGRYRQLGGKIPKGVLVVGAPGTGKTLLAKAVAGEAGVPFFNLSGSDFVEIFVGVGAARVRDLFAQAQQRAPCIIFIDELDALGKARGASPVGGHDEREQTLNQLLVEMDGFETDKSVIIMAATNRPEMLDAALLRPGRFDRHVVVDRPDLNGREQILKIHTRQVRLADDASLAKLAGLTPGFVGADLANLVNEAALHAARNNKTVVEMSDFEEALDRIVGGLERKNRVMNATEKRTIAYHEAGHALVAESRVHADRVSKISIIPRGVAALGYTQQLPTEDRYLLKKSELLDRLDVLLGGRVAEEIVFGDVSTGAQNDLQRATDMARLMVTQYGMSERLGLATFEQQSPSMFLNVQVPAQQGQHEYSERTARTIDAEVHKLLDEAHARVSQTLAAQRATLDTLSALLLEKEVVDREALLQIPRVAEIESHAGTG
ncbi:MAG TPA: ATP-dependent zinc metalloprotease FtsH [Burkholderiales bacterium]|nr:ATP-dependent zinc metalloprotease FtsH [Burkholderiales bacterium]